MMFNWKNKISSYSSSHYWARVLVASYRGFVKHRSYLKAAQLTYYSLLSIVPILAVAFGIAKGFNFEQYFENQLYQRFAEHKIVVNRAIDFANNLLVQTQQGVFVALGFLGLFWTVLLLLENIEVALNEIWGVKTHRTLYRKIIDYFVLIIFCPFFFAFSNSAALYLFSRLIRFTETTFFGPMRTEITFSFQLFIPFFLSWVLFGFVYFVMPNTKVGLKYGIIASIVGGTLYQILQWIYITFQVGVANMGAIYGSFAALPLFLVWLDTSWLIFLYGAEIGFYAEDESYSFRSTGHYCESNKIEIALLIASYSVQAFYKGEPPFTIKQISKKLSIPVSKVVEIVEELIQNHILIELHEKNAFQPAKYVETITLQEVINAMSTARQTPVSMPSIEDLGKIKALLNNFDQAQENSKQNIKLKDCLN
jgi:membrane protein